MRAMHLYLPKFNRDSAVEGQLILRKWYLSVYDSVADGGYFV